VGVVGAEAGTASFEAFYLEEFPVMFRMAFLIIGERAAAEDVVQEGFARAYARWSRVGGYEKPGAWLRLVVVRLAVRYRSSRRREVGGKEEGVVASPDTTVRDQIVAALAALSSGERAAVVLHYLCDLPVGEVSLALRVRPGTVRVQLHRARSKLAGALAEEIESAR
jgi:RNA polymerase sigma-70 factor (ECF subfamily)